MTKAGNFDVSDLVAFALVFVAVFAGERDGEERVLVAVDDQDRKLAGGVYTEERFQAEGAGMRGDGGDRSGAFPADDVCEVTAVRHAENVDAVVVDLVAARSL